MIRNKSEEYGKWILIDNNAAVGVSGPYVYRSSWSVGPVHLLINGPTGTALNSKCLTEKLSQQFQVPNFGTSTL